MTDKEKKKILTALYSYNTFKAYLRNGAQRGGVMVLDGAGGTTYISEGELAKAIQIAEGTLAFYEIQDETKAAFVRQYFFKRESWVKLTGGLCISNGTVNNWRNEIIEVAAKIARKNDFI